MATKTNPSSEPPVRLRLDPATIKLLAKYDSPMPVQRVETTHTPPRMLHTIVPGIYYDVPVEVYNSLPCVRATYLEIIGNGTPATCLHTIQNPDETTAAMAFGSAWHCAFLEPQLFPKKYVLWDKKDDAGKPKKRAGKVWDEFVAANSTKSIMREQDYDKCLAMAKSLQAHPEVVQLFSRDAKREATLIWQDKLTGLWCKARVDALVEGEAPTLGDLKSTVDANPYTFGKAIANYGYDIQCGLYAMGARNLMPNAAPPNFVIAPCEKEPPYLCSFVEVERPTMKVGWIRARAALDTYAQCIKTGIWPGYPKDIIPVNAPKWHLDKYQVLSPGDG